MATLADWLKHASPDDRLEVATSCGTTVNYLYQIAGGHVKSPGVVLAAGLSRAIGRLSKASGGDLPTVSIEEIAGLLPEE